MANTPPVFAPARPTPAATLPLAFGIFAAPAAWAIQLVVNYALAASACFSRGVARVDIVPSASGHAKTTMLVIGIACALIGIAGFFVALRQLRLAIAPPGVHHAERRRALAKCGVLSSLLFVAAIAFSLFVLMTPQCAG
jgi:Sec-independent protein secretion pathway component TatC